jgi:hypothetical protein
MCVCGGDWCVSVCVCVYVRACDGVYYFKKEINE